MDTVTRGADGQTGTSCGLPGPNATSRPNAKSVLGKSYYKSHFIADSELFDQVTFNTWQSKFKSK